MIQDEDELNCHEKLFQKFKAIHVSSDESDYGDPSQPVFRRVRPVWRSADFQTFLWRLDDIALARKVAPVNWKQGRGPRFRPRTKKVNRKSKPPPGLPRNCYDQTWLDSLRPFQQRILDPQDNYDFSLPTQYASL